MTTAFFRFTILQSLVINNVFANTFTANNTERSSEPSGLKVGIVGAGIAGLYAGLILRSVNLDFQILEGKRRAGGRLFTYKFFPKAPQSSCLSHAYFDVGAMRFPSSWLYERQFGDKSYSLINYLNSRIKKRLKVIRFIFKSDHNIWYLNGRRAFQSDVEQQKEDLFHVGTSNGGNVPPKYAQESGLSLRLRLLQPFIDAINENYTEGMRYLHSFDKFTFREYAMNGPSRLPDSAIDYMPQSEIFRLGFTTVARLYIPELVSGVKWRTVEGGSSKIVRAMALLLKGKVHFGETVKAIVPTQYKKLQIISKRNGRRSYDHIILTPSISSMKSIDLSKLKLSFMKRKAFEVFHYLDSVKVGLLFRKRWWQDKEIMRGRPILGGESTTDLPIRTVTFPSNGLNCTEHPSALLTSYTFEDPAHRMTGLPEKDVVNLVLDNLSEMFNLDIRKYYAGKYYIHRWEKDGQTLGAFRFLDSGHLTEYLKEMLTPEANGRLHFGGDASSVFPWSHDSMTDAYYSVLQILKYEGMTSKMDQVTSIWGQLEDKWSFLRPL